MQYTFRLTNSFLKLLMIHIFFDTHCKELHVFLHMNFHLSMLGFLGCNAVWTHNKISTFPRNILPPSSGPKSAQKLVCTCQSTRSYNFTRPPSTTSPLREFHISHNAELRNFQDRARHGHLTIQVTKNTDVIFFRLVKSVWV
jgi:hypothetical protein